MDKRSAKSRGGEATICLQIDEQVSLPMQLSDNCCSTTMFEPQRELNDAGRSADSNIHQGSSERQTDHAPEKKLTLFALRLAILEKSASGLGTLSFIWATVVLLGGFAITLEKTDFWLITTILLIEGTRIFSRSHELEWQHQATWSLTGAGKYSFRALKSSSNFIIHTIESIFGQEMRSSGQLTDKPQVAALRSRKLQESATRTWQTPDVPLLPYTEWACLSRNISKLLYWLQLLSASACISLSLMRLIQQDYGEISKGDSDKRNRKSALNIFYGLALAEALLFLMEKAYWEYKVSYCKLLEEVNNECELGHTGIVSIKRFFYDAYSRCVYGSIFDGLKMDLASFAVELLASDSSDEQLSGARMLQKFATSERFSDDTLRKIGTSNPVMDRLVEMLNWKNPSEEEIRKSAAGILSKLAGRKQNSLRVAGIPGAMESISSLLYTGGSSSRKADEISRNTVTTDQVNYEFSAFNLLGLLILKKLANDPDNCGKIGNTRGLLPKIIGFTHTGERLLKDKLPLKSQTILVKRSLQLVKLLASTSGKTGEILRHEIAEIVFTISNIRQILQHGENQTDLQQLGIEILTSLALDEDAKEMIGSTGGVIKELLHILFKQGLPESQGSVREAAGEALAMLTLESEKNCKQVLRLGALEKLVDSLNETVLRLNSARILRNLCAYSGRDCFHMLKGVSAAAATVLKATMSEENKIQEVAIGLATQIFRFTNSNESDNAFEKSGIRQTELAETLVHILKQHQYPSIKVPRIRRFVIELAIWMMKSKDENIHIFKDLGMEKELQNVTETTSELECFNVFSGTTGLSRHKTTVYSLVDIALELIAHH